MIIHILLFQHDRLWGATRHLKLTNRKYWSWTKKEWNLTNPRRSQWVPSAKFPINSEHQQSIKKCAWCLHNSVHMPTLRTAFSLPPPLILLDLNWCCPQQPNPFSHNVQALFIGEEAGIATSVVLHGGEYNNLIFVSFKAIHCLYFNMGNHIAWWSPIETSLVCHIHFQ